MEKLPKARTENIIIQEAGDELLVYDTENNKAYCLNKTAASVWKACDGKTAKANLRLNGNEVLSTDLTELALYQLQKQNLLEGVAVSQPRFNRREMIAKYGAAAIALPVISTLVAPTTANAQSFQRNCSTLPIPFPPGCEFSSTSTTCSACQQALVQTTNVVCQSGAASIDPTCTPNTDPQFVNCTAVCL